MKKLVSFRVLALLSVGLLAHTGFCQSFKASSEGLLQTFQDPGPGRPWGFQVNFMPNGPLGKEWIYGSWFDSDSLERAVAYRKGGKWVPLPFHMTSSFYTADIVQFGDTMYIGGFFNGVVLDKDSSNLPPCTVLKMFNDSIWPASFDLDGLHDLEVSGDSLFAWASSYSDSDTIISGVHLLTINNDASWRYPYDPVHPTGSSFDFGANANLQVHNNSVYTLNDATYGHFNGVVKWDGSQWTGFGSGIYGTFSKAFDFAFYENELYMGGSFNRQEDPRNPGEFIAKWNGDEWQSVGGGVNQGVFGLFTYDSLLFCYSDGDTYGDVQISYFAAWDGDQWCGTPINYSGTPPSSFGFINDTLFASFRSLPATANGQQLSYINYCDGDYVNGPNSICSTPGLGKEEVTTEKGGLELYPNPAGDEVQISLKSLPVSQVRLFNLYGRLVLEWQWNQPVHHVTLDIGCLQRGIYLVDVNGSGHHRLVKQ